MSVHHLLAADVMTMSAGRLGATTAALVGLAGTVVGALALARRTGRAVIALAAGLTAMALGGLVAITAEGGIGTGNGLGGAYVALIVGLISTVLGGLARAQKSSSSRR